MNLKQKQSRKTSLQKTQKASQAKRWQTPTKKQNLNKTNNQPPSDQPTTKKQAIQMMEQYRDQKDKSEFQLWQKQKEMKKLQDELKERDMKAQQNQKRYEETITQSLDVINSLKQEFIKKSCKQSNKNEELSKTGKQPKIFEIRHSQDPRAQQLLEENLLRVNELEKQVQQRKNSQLDQVQNKPNHAKTEVKQEKLPVKFEIYQPASSIKLLGYDHLLPQQRDQKTLKVINDLKKEASALTDDLKSIRFMQNEQIYEREQNLNKLQQSFKRVQTKFDDENNNQNLPKSPARETKQQSELLVTEIKNNRYDLQNSIKPSNIQNLKEKRELDKEEKRLRSKLDKLRVINKVMGNNYDSNINRGSGTIESQDRTISTGGHKFVSISGDEHYSDQHYMNMKNPYYLQAFKEKQYSQCTLKERDLYEPTASYKRTIEQEPNQSIKDHLQEEGGEGTQSQYRRSKVASSGCNELRVRLK